MGCAQLLRERTLLSHELQGVVLVLSSISEDWYCPLKRTQIQPLPCIAVSESQSTPRFSLGA